MASFGLYLHIPYCRMKCPYCDFNVYAAARWPEREYTAALVAEMSHYAEQEPWRRLELGTIYFGGGTPSLFAPASIDAAVQAARRLWLPAASGEAVMEISLEANPGTLSPESLRGYRTAGVNRLSLGVQSFEPRHLERLGRDHTPSEAVAAVEMARAAGFDNVSVDLIFGVPGQTLDEWQQDLHTAIEIGASHISAYGLTFEEGTPFHVMRSRGYLSPIAEDSEADMFVRSREILEAAGLRHYEVSNYACPGYESRHNLNYWRGGEYLGVGTGAHSFARTPAPGARWSGERHPNRYIHRVEADGHARVWEEQLTDRQARGEFVFLGLRARDGFSTAEFATRFGEEFASAFPHSMALSDDGLLVAERDRWRLSERGLLLADRVFATFL